MKRAACLLGVLAAFSAGLDASPQDQAPPKKTPAGVYAVQRQGLKEKDVLPLRDGEVLLVHRHRYLKKAENEPPRYLIVRTAPDVALDLAGAPKADKDGEEVVRILLKLQPKAASALERLTRDHEGKEIAIVLAGEVVTMHKVRQVIKGGEVQITSCAPGAARFLLDQLQTHVKMK